MRTFLQKDSVVIVMLFFINAFIKFFFINSQPVGLDEPFSIFHAQLETREIIHYLVKGNNPPLFEIILHYWISIFGISSFAVRFLPYLFSIFTLPFVYKIGSKFFNKQTAIIASVLFMFSNINTYFAFEVRVYSLLVLLAVISQYLFLCIQKNSKKQVTKVLFVAINILMLYAHYFGMFIMFIQAITLIVNKTFRQKTKTFLLLYLLVIISFLPLLITVFNQLYASSTAGTWVSQPSGIKSLYYMLIHFCNSPVSSILILLLLIASIFIKTTTKEFKPNLLIALWFFIPFVGMFLVSFFVPMYIPRYIVYGAPALYILIAYRSTFLIKNKPVLNYIIMGIVVVSFVFSVKLNPPKNSQEKEISDIILKRKQENTALLLSPAYFTINFTYNFDKNIFAAIGDKDIYSKQYSLLKKQNIMVISKKDNIDFEYLNSFDTIMFYDAGSSFLFPNNGLFETLNNHYTLQEKHECRKDFTLYFFTKPMSE